MALPIVLIAVALPFSTLAWSKPTPYTCTSAFVPITVENVTTFVPPFPYPFPNGYAATSFANAVTQRDPSMVAPTLTSISATFNISTLYCTPNHVTNRRTTLQLLSHGIGFDKNYWDIRLPSAPDDPQYSYIYSVTTAGYSTFSYDRLGTGLSTLANPYTEIQALVELAILTQLTILLKAGNIPNIPKPAKILHIGHSFGSELSNALVAATPALSDGVILTAWSNIATYTREFVANSAYHLASVSQPARFGNYSTGFLTWSDEYDNQYSFLEYPYFDPAVLAYAESTKYPFTAGEFVSATALNFAAGGFTGPVLYLPAEHDLIMCGYDCKGLFGSESAARLAFPNAISWEAYIQPNVGHGINLHYNASGAYGVALDWADRHGF